MKHIFHTIIFLILVIIAGTTATTLQSCTKSEVKQLADSLQQHKPATIADISEHKGTLTVTVLTAPDSIGMLEQAHAVRCIVTHKDIFNKALTAMQHTEGSHLRLSFKAKGGNDKQNFEYDIQTLQPILSNSDKALKEAEEWLQMLQQEDAIFGDSTTTTLQQ